MISAKFEQMIVEQSKTKKRFYFYLFERFSIINIIIYLNRFLLVLYQLSFFFCSTGFVAKDSTGTKAAFTHGDLTIQYRTKKLYKIFLCCQGHAIYSL